MAISFRFQDGTCHPGAWKFVFRLMSVNTKLRGAGLLAEPTCTPARRRR